MSLTINIVGELDEAQLERLARALDETFEDHDVALVDIDGYAAIGKVWGIQSTQEDPGYVSVAAYAALGANRLGWSTQESLSTEHQAGDGESAVDYKSFRLRDAAVVTYVTGRG